MEGQGLRPGQPLLSAFGNAFHVRGMCRVIIELQGHFFCVTALVISELDNLGVDCLLGGDASITWEVSLWAKTQNQSTRSLGEVSAQLGAVIFLSESMLANM